MSKNNKKMTINELVNKYTVLNNEELKKNLVESIVTVRYVSYEQKCDVCKRIVDVTYYTKTKNHNDYEYKKLHVDSTANYMLYCLNLVDYYTTVSIDYKKSLEEFNELNKTGLLDMIIAYIPEREIKEFRMILDMIESDVIQNEYETHAFISNQVERFGELAGIAITPILEQLIKSINNIDDKQIDKILNGLKGIEKLNKFKSVK